MKKTQPIDFTKQEKKRRSLFGVLFVVLAVILAGAVSFVVLLSKNEFDLARFFGTRAPEDTVTESFSENTGTEDVSVQPFSDENSVNFLLICSDSATKSVDFCDIISISYAEKVIRVKPVSKEITLQYNGADYTLNDLFALSSAGAVRDALTERGLTVNRYVSVNETNFKMILQKLGPVDIILRNEISYSVDAITYSFPAGVQSMTADALLKYMKYADTGDALLPIQGEAMAQILRTHFTAENIDRGDEFFAELINLVDSDISAFDYAHSRSELSELLASKPPVNTIS